MILRVVRGKIFGGAVIVLCLLYLFLGARSASSGEDPWRGVAKKSAPVSHAHVFTQTSFPDGPSVTRACLRCHPQAAKEMMATSHWTWLGGLETIPGRPRPVMLGKRNAINNFCISIEGNWPKCTSCHAGYGWKDASFDFSRAENVDCLVCHDQTHTYVKGPNGLPTAEVNLLTVAKSVGRPTRDNCGFCHFNGGGGDAVKHGDLDGSLAKPGERLDVHMGRLGFQCITCHRTQHHAIAGRMISVSPRDSLTVNCTDCHSPTPHHEERLNGHTAAVACQTCHIPEVALKEATKVAWDWSTAGRDVEEADPHTYLKIKGSFLYAKGVLPEYRWFNGNATRYIKGDPVDSTRVTHLNSPVGDIHDPSAKVWPFKVHRGKQPYDVVYKVLSILRMVGPGGFWTDFDWQKAAVLGAQSSGLPFSGQLGFTETDMYWVLSHMVAPKERALRCNDCHGDHGRLDWEALGYPGDPAQSGGRAPNRLIAGGKGEWP